MKTALDILKEKYLLIENDKTCEAHTHLVVEAMEEYTQAALNETKQMIDEMIEKLQSDKYGISNVKKVFKLGNKVEALTELKNKL